MNSEETKQITTQLKGLFRVYDIDNSGELDKDELYLVLNDLRKSLGLGGQPKKLFAKCCKIIDIDQSGAVNPKELTSSLSEIFPLVCKPDHDLAAFIKKKFKQMDGDNSGYLERVEIKKLLDELCDQMKRQMCEQWRIDYIFSLLDENGDNQIDIDEFMYNYNIIHTELDKNPPLGICAQKYQKMCEARDRNQDKLQIENLAGIAKKFQKVQKIAGIRAARDILNEDKRLDDMNMDTNKEAKKIMPIDDLINAMPIVVTENVEEKQHEIINIAIEYDKVVDDDSKNKDKDCLEYFLDKNLTEIVRFSCQNLVILKKLMSVVKKLMTSKIYGIIHKKEDRENLQDYQNSIVLINETFLNMKPYETKERQTQTWNAPTDDVGPQLIKRRSSIAIGVGFSGDLDKNFGTMEKVEITEKAKAQIQKKNRRSTINNFYSDITDLQNSQGIQQIDKILSSRDLILQSPRTGGNLLNGICSPILANRIIPESSKNMSNTFFGTGTPILANIKIPESSKNMSSNLSKGTPILTNRKIPESPKNMSNNFSMGIPNLGGTKILLDSPKKLSNTSAMLTPNLGGTKNTRFKTMSKAVVSNTHEVSSKRVSDRGSFQIQDNPVLSRYLEKKNTMELRNVVDQSAIIKPATPKIQKTELYPNIQTNSVVPNLNDIVWNQGSIKKTKKPFAGEAYQNNSSSFKDGHRSTMNSVNSGFQADAMADSNKIHSNRSGQYDKTLKSNNTNKVDMDKLRQIGKISEMHNNEGAICFSSDMNKKGTFKKKICELELDI